MGKKINCTDEQIINASKVANSATAAAAMLGIQYGTYRKHAERLGVFITNQAGVGLKKPITDDRKILLEDILAGNHPQYQSNKIRVRLLKEGVKPHVCECCGITEWQGKPAPLELDHIDGDRHNHKFKNLRLLCPNCHSQTETYRGKNTRK
jgi:hypothetical protein